MGPVRGMIVLTNISVLFQIVGAYGSCGWHHQPQPNVLATDPVGLEAMVLLVNGAFELQVCSHELKITVLFGLTYT